GGARTELLPHQLYIAHEVGKRLAPRVLLADEVGLGKTIEACLILHHQILTGQVSRVLIVVPDSLLHQWLVELLRRFNLQFSLYDESRCKAIETSDQHNNPFLAEQLVLCGLSLLTDNPQRHKQALQGEWDLLIVDEAHHLTWSPEQVSVEYQAIEGLAQQTPGVLLLTATPEQLGRASHFARLRLLDPNRFHDLDTFLAEEQSYQPVADAVSQLLDENQTPDQQSTQQLLSQLDEAESIPLLATFTNPERSDAEKEQVREQLIDRLLDRHGTGRVLFRNTRNRIKGFPKRQLHSYPLALPEAYQRFLDDEETPPEQLLTPEALYRGHPGTPWYEFDPRVEWLINTLGRLQDEKVLLICAHASTALELSEALRLREGILAAVFHEGLSIVERDRAAAWFADQEAGCQLLICSEIGSEGRNFQFASNLILFDLPLNPDLLEQRIGRLDRIGQKSTIQLHVPYFEESGQAVLLRWLDEGLTIFNGPCPAGNSLFRQLQPALLEALEVNDPDQAQIEQLMATTQQLHQELNEALQKGRDHLLEINSCREPTASEIKHQIEIQESEHPLPAYLDNLLARFGVDTEEHSPGNIILRPGNHMITDSIPGLLPEGMTCTFDRHTALSHEDRHFLTWEHPLTRGCIEMVTNLEQGRSCAATLKHPAITSGSLMLEMLFILHCPAPKVLQAGRFLPAIPIRLLINQKNQEISGQLDYNTFSQALSPLEKPTAKKIIQSLRGHIGKMIEQGETIANQQREQFIAEAIRQSTEHFSQESERLLALQKVNPNVRPEEIEAMMTSVEILHEHLLEAQMKLDAIRLVVSI
ncbi:MAG: RNA polymerase-associated protein RapA, partial [Chromatiales bacterium]|nr:RNA polymerase-associated protein RapA [Chromatiales bacterium]